MALVSNTYHVVYETLKQKNSKNQRHVFQNIPVPTGSVRATLLFCWNFLRTPARTNPQPAPMFSDNLETLAMNGEPADLSYIIRNIIEQEAARNQVIMRIPDRKEDFAPFSNRICPDLRHVNPTGGVRRA